MSQTHYEELVDYRRCVAALYGHVRSDERMRQSGLDLEARWQQFCRERDALFAAHPQSALSAEQKKGFTGLRYYPYDPHLRFLLEVEPAAAGALVEVDLPDEGILRLQRFGRAHFQIDGASLSLSLFWIQAYGGGIFLPFRDLTNQTDTYGGGRYLLDTIKHADLGQEGGRLVVDFNYAYNPSCAYNPRWVCPLSPPENRLSVPIRAGEWLYTTELR